MIKTELVEYQADNLTMKGHFAFDASNSNQRKPCIMIVHDWSGCNEMAQNKAKELARLGYVAFAVDMFGNGKLGQTNEEKMALIEPLIQDRKLIAQRMQAAFDTAIQLPFVDAQNIAAIGYCFGGACVLDFARTGIDIAGVVSFHGLLDAPETKKCAKIKTKVLVLHGYEDPMVSPKQVNQFADEMTQAKADWQIHMYGHTGHAFANPNANDKSLGLYYSAVADKRSWNSALQFFNEIFS